MVLFFGYLDIRHGASKLEASDRFMKAIGWIFIVTFAGWGLTLGFGILFWLLVTQILPIFLNEWGALEYLLLNWEPILVVFFCAFCLVCSVYNGPFNFDDKTPNTKP